MKGFEENLVRVTDDEEAPTVEAAVEAPVENKVETTGESTQEKAAESTETSEAAVAADSAAKEEKLASLHSELTSNDDAANLEFKKYQLNEAQKRLDELNARSPEEVSAEITAREKAFNGITSRLSRWFTKNVTRAHPRPGVSEENAIGTLKRSLEERNKLPGQIEQQREEIARLS